VAARIDSATPVARRAAAGVNCYADLTAALQYLCAGRSSGTAAAASPVDCPLAPSSEMLQLLAFLLLLGPAAYGADMAAASSGLQVRGIRSRIGHSPAVICLAGDSLR
jgi:hypothetical protein